MIEERHFLISFKVVARGTNTLVPAVLPLMEALQKVLLVNRLENLRRIRFDDVDAFKPFAFQR